MIAAENGLLHRPVSRAVIPLSRFIQMSIFMSDPKAFLRFVFLAAAFALPLAGFPAANFAQETTDEDPVAAFNQAQDLHEKGDLEGAIKLYEKALKIEPAFPEAEFQRGIAELALRRPAEAEKAFRRAITLRETWTLPMTSLGSLLIEKGEIGEAEKVLSKAVEIEPQNAVALSALTELRVNGGASRAVLEDLLSKITPLTSKANAGAALWTAKAAVENALGQRSAAKTSVNKALAADPKNRNAIFLFASISFAEGDLDYARDLAARVSQPPSDQEKMLRASILAAEGNADEALKAVNSIEKPGKSAIELRDRLVASKQTNPADLEKLLEKNPADAAILGRLCNLYRRENPEKALRYCRSASEAEPNNIFHAIGFGAALVQAKQYDSAVQIFRKILEIVPDNATARANLASALFQLKRYVEAKTEFQWLIDAQPKLAGPHLFLAIIHDEAGEHLDAMANYQQYLRLADPVANKLDVEKVNLRLPLLQKLINSKKK